MAEELRARRMARHERERRRRAELVQGALFWLAVLAGFAIAGTIDFYTLG